MDLPETPPSLIDYIKTPDNGFYIDLTFPLPDRGDESVRKGHFTNTLPARIVTDSGGTIGKVLLVKQRDRYEAPDSLVSITNMHLEQAWQNSLIFHRSTGDHQAPMMVNHQVGTQGDLKAFRALFVCQATQKWFHPVCPQCGLPLTLCKDDALLQQRGLPAYADSLRRFMFCESCVRLSETAPMYCREKAADLPDSVQDKDALVAQWQHLLAALPDEADLPCRGCPSTKECYGTDSLAHQHIQAFGFYPFYMLILPAPSMDATQFLQLVSAGPCKGEVSHGQEDSPSETRRFLFLNQDREFLEILFLKLTFLEQVACQLIPEADAATLQEFDLSLDGIGIDLYPSGTGLPAYWNFSARILDAVGSFLDSPFASGPPIPSRLHFLGALWFRTLLVNSRQTADNVFAEVQQAVSQLTDERGLENWSVDRSHSPDRFAPAHIFWLPDDRAIPEKWHRFWEQTLRFGLKMVQAGLKTGIAWDREMFRAELALLKDAIQTEMFSSEVSSAAPSASAPAASDRIQLVLSQILQKWQAQAAVDHPTPPEASPPNDEATIVSAAPLASSPAQPRSNREPSVQPPLQPEETGWDLDIQETVILKAPQEAMPNGTPPQERASQTGQESAWGDDDQATVVIQRDAPGTTDNTPTTQGSDDLEKTMVISPGTQSSDQPASGPDLDGEATIVQGRRVPPSPSIDSPDNLDATVILNTGAPPTIEKQPVSEDDDLAATVVQHSGDHRPAHGSNRKETSTLEHHSSATTDDLDATIVLKPSGQPSDKDHSPGAIDDDLVATMVQTPRSSVHPVGQPKSEKSASPPPVHPQSTGDQSRAATAPSDDDDDIMEQTIIIRSDNKKE